MQPSSAGRSRWLALIVVLTAPLLYVIDIFIINMAIPGIQRGVQATGSEMQLVIAGYLLGSASFLITGGRAGDYLGRKKVFFAGMLGFTLTSCCCGLAQSAGQLNLMRFLQGISSSFMVPQAIAFIQVLFPEPRERAKAVGWYGTTLSIAAIIGQMLGGWLVDIQWPVAGWRMIFFINLPVGLAALWAIRKYLAETPAQQERRFDWSGALLLTLSLSGLIYGLTQGREAGWPLWSLLLLPLSLLLFAFFLWRQRRQQAAGGTPLVDPGLFRLKGFSTGLLAVLFHFMLHTAYLLMIAVFLQEGLRLSALACGIYFLPHALLFMISALLASRWIIRWGKGVLLAGLGIILLSFVLQLAVYRPGMPSWPALVLIALYGLGNGMVLPSLLTVALRNIPEAWAGTASGVFSTAQQTASALGISIIGGIFYTAAGNPSRPDYLRAFDWGMYAAVVCLFFVAVMLYRLPQLEHKAAVTIMAME